MCIRDRSEVAPALITPHKLMLAKLHALSPNMSFTQAMVELALRTIANEKVLAGSWRLSEKE
eukprot:1312457-Alexandrium_andersonii.AAC.1